MGSAVLWEACRVRPSIDIGAEQIVADNCAAFARDENSCRPDYLRASIRRTQYARRRVTQVVGERMHGQPPVVIEPYDPAWPLRFEAERSLLAPVLAPWLAGPIVHIGSTSVPELAAKPVIDIMAAVQDLHASVDAIEVLKPLSYCYFPYRADVMHWFCKPSDFTRTHHLHLVPMNSQLWRDRIAFRDLLRSNVALRNAYASLKFALASTYREDREAYTEAKSDFIQSALLQIPG